MTAVYFGSLGVCFAKRSRIAIVFFFKCRLDLPVVRKVSGRSNDEINRYVYPP